MKVIELFESKQGSLYHSMNLEYAEDAIQKDRILATSIQRWSESGRMLRDPEFTYNFKYGSREELLKNPDTPEEIRKDVQAWEDSNWYLGVSMTRSKQFAGKWKGVVFELDYTGLAQRYKIIPWNWGSSKNRYKKEFEEFVVLKKSARDYVDAGKAGRPDETNPKIPLSRYLKGIWLSHITWDVYTRSGTQNDPTVNFIQAHPLYKGILPG